MKTAFTLILLLLPAPLIAGSAFDQMIGTWRGEGKYTEGIAEVDLRCRIAISGDTSAIHMAGRCASSLGGEDFTMDFELGPNRNVQLQRSESERGADSKITGLSGPLGSNGMVVRGSAEGEEVVVQLLLNGDDTLVFATREVSPGKTTVSYVTLARQ